MKRFLLVLVIPLMTWCSSKPQSEGTNSDNESINTTVESIDRFVEQLMDDYGIGGAIGIGIVKDGETIVEKAYGYRDRSKGLSATEETPFYIASMTKSFMGTLAVLLKENGEIDIDAPLKPNLGFVPPDDINLEGITIEDLFTHTSGIGNPAVSVKTAFLGSFSEEEIYRDLETLSFPVTQGFQYSNLGYIIGGLILKRQLGKDWKDLLDDRLFGPLKMVGTSARVSDYGPDELAKPHEYSGEYVRAVPFLKTDETMHAAGGMFSTVTDMNRWMKFHLSKTPGIMSSQALDYIHTDLVGYYGQMGTLNNYGYGMGWNQADWKEYPITWHGGGYPGYGSRCLLSREENLGIVILMNQETPIMNLLVDFLLGSFLEVPNFEAFISDRKEAINSVWERYQFVRDSILEEGSKRHQLTRNIKDYEGLYLSEKFGEAVVKADSQTLQITLGNLSFHTNYTGDDSFFFYSDGEQLFGWLDFYFETKILGKPTITMDFSGETYKRLTKTQTTQNETKGTTSSIYNSPTDCC